MLGFNITGPLWLSLYEQTTTTKNTETFFKTSTFVFRKESHTGLKRHKGKRWQHFHLNFLYIKHSKCRFKGSCHDVRSSFPSRTAVTLCVLWRLANAEHVSVDHITLEMFQEGFAHFFPISCSIVLHKPLWHGGAGLYLELTHCVVFDHYLKHYQRPIQHQFV